MSILFIILFFAIVMFINMRNVGVKNFEDYATARGSFGMMSVALAVFSTWYVGASFTAWAGFSVGNGFLGSYVIPYASMMMIAMYLLSERTFLWGKKYSINTQAELMDLRYKSKALRVIVGLSGVIFTAPWLLMEWVTQGYIFSYATNGVVSPFWGMLIGVVVVLIYVSTGGMKSVITANFFQGIFMFVIGTGVMMYLIFHFFGSFSESMNLLNEKYPEVLTYPGPGWNPPSSYWTSLVIASGLGAFMWPWVFNKLFVADSVKSLKQSTLIAPLLGLIFWAVFTFLGQTLHTFDFARANPEEAYLWIANEAGPLPLALMSTMIMAASVATVAAIVQAMATAISNDVAQVINKKITDSQALKIARTSVIVIGILALIGATIDMGALIFLALTTYQGIIMLFPVVVLGLFWKRANKEGAIASIIVGTTVSMFIEITALPAITQYGWTGGMYGSAIAFLIMIIAGYLKPVESHVEALWKDIADAKSRKRKKSQSVA